MFTGIIEQCSTISQRMEQGNDWNFTLVIRNPFDSDRDPLRVGESIAVNGVCLTLVPSTLKPNDLIFEISPETLEKTRLGQLQPGHPVHLERALQLSDRISGHLVYGHVDGLAEVISSKKIEHGCLELKLRLPSDLIKYCITKGSITVDGVSLTINAVQESLMTIALMIIPHTLSVTRLGQLEKGDQVHIEIDPIAKWVEKLCQPQNLKP